MCNKEEKYENTEICKNCAGKCCKSMGCHMSPEDIKGEITYDNLKGLIDAGNISIDWWYGNPLDDNDDCRDKAFYLRMRNKKAPIVDESWGGECILLTENGCSLEYNDRPKGARLLIPKENNCCEDNYPKKQSAIDWIPYRDILSKLVDYYNN